MPRVPRDGVNRRVFLGSAAASLGGVALAGQGGNVPAGPPVWLDMDQATLDAAYDQTVWAPNRLQILGRFATNSELARGRLGPPRRFTYGPSEIEHLDVFVADRADAPVLVFIHGGAWREGLARNYAFLAEPFVRAGAHVAILDFTNVVDTSGDLRPMAAQARRAIAWLFENAGSFGGDPRRLFVSGHSSGGHLAGMVLTTDWRGAYGLPGDIVRAGLCVSGMFDLEPVSLSSRREYVDFTPEVLEALSPQRHLDRLACPVVVAYGTLETPEFQRQSRDFAAAVAAAGLPVELIVGEGYNHFELIETLANPYGLMGRTALELMGLS